MEPNRKDYTTTVTARIVRQGTVFAHSEEEAEEMAISEFDANHTRVLEHETHVEVNLVGGDVQTPMTELERVLFIDCINRYVYQPVPEAITRTIEIYDGYDTDPLLEYLADFAVEEYEMWTPQNTLMQIDDDFSCRFMFLQGNAKLISQLID